MLVLFCFVQLNMHLHPTSLPCRDKTQDLHNGCSRFFFPPKRSFWIPGVGTRGEEILDQGHRSMDGGHAQDIPSLPYCGFLFASKSTEDVVPSPSSFESSTLPPCFITPGSCLDIVPSLLHWGRRYASLLGQGHCAAFLLRWGRCSASMCCWRHHSISVLHAPFLVHRGHRSPLMLCGVCHYPLWPRRERCSSQAGDIASSFSGAEDRLSRTLSWTYVLWNTGEGLEPMIPMSHCTTSHI